MKFKFIIFLLVGISFTNAQKLKYHKCTLDKAIFKLMAIPEVKKQIASVDSLSQHKEGLSFIDDIVVIDGKKYFRIKTGYSGEFHWDTYTIFYVDHKTCSKILVNDTVSGNILTLKQWRATQQ